MTEEQKNNPDYEDRAWGILVEYWYKEAFQRSFNRLSVDEKKKQIKQLKELPNFDKDIFFEISWIDIEEKTELTLEEIAEKFNIPVENLKIKK